ncbi:MAG: helix-turn-helix domain-containing protein [Candidatus Krumholzibacteria bacterium]|nr:helix-turn-helix domain-containing protein [Candidatus Krumholzibacteria bacterium]
MTPKQRKALSSPIRLEILGNFTTPGGMSIADIAERMGRPASALYYHIRILEKVGVLRQVGERPRTKRAEALYDVVADRIAYPTKAGVGSQGRDALKAMSVAFRMAERDLEAALASGKGRRDGENRNFFASRAHCRASKSTLAKVNKLLREVDNILTKESRRNEYSDDATEFFSLTVALLPLRGRESQ